MNRAVPNKCARPAGAWRGLLQLALVVWAAALTLYFEYKEGLIRWAWLAEPAQNGFFRERGLPDPRLAPSPSLDMPQSPYMMILKNAMGPYLIQWENAPWLDLGIASAMVMALWALGWLILDCFETYMPRLARGCLALTLGCGAMGIGCEALAMAGQLNRFAVATLWIAMFAAALSVWAAQRRNWHTPESLPDGGRLSLSARRDVAAEWFVSLYPAPFGLLARVYIWLAAALVLIISAIITLHAIGEPETYWDSLILYMGYARMTFLEQGFPEMVAGQVGLGLGANYPHLYAVLSAQTAALAGYWSDSFAQVLPPVVSLAAMLLVFSLALELSRDRVTAWSVTLLYRAVPYGICYSQYASDYAVAIYFTTAFLYLAWRYVQDGLPAYRWLMLIVAAGAVHINYLMWGLWPVAMLAIVLAHRPYCSAAEMPERVADDYEEGHGVPQHQMMAPGFVSLVYRSGFWELVTRRSLWCSLLVALALAAPWYVRNVIVTGNPVYAFYANVFPSKNVNLDVMRSAEQEWLNNGDGLGRVGGTLMEKLRNSWLYFVTGSQHWKLAPVFMAFVVPGFLVAMALAVGWRLRRRRHETVDTFTAAKLRFALAAASLFLLLWFYAYVVADFYLYQIIIVLPLFGVFAAFVFDVCRAKTARLALCCLALLIGIAPGLVMALMGFKLKNTGVYESMESPQFSVTALRRLFIDPDIFYRMEFGGDMDMLGRVNQLPAGTAVLTHENRHLLLDPKIAIIHLDDWEIQKAYGKSVRERMRILDEQKIAYYLYVTNEDKHVANSWLDMEELISAGYFVKEHDTPASAPSSPALTNHEVIPAHKNVLYKRSSKKAGI